MTETSYKALAPWRPTTITRAFVLNSLVIALVAGVSIEVRGILDVYKWSKTLSRWDKMKLTIGATFLVGVIVYFTLRTIVGFGGAMVTNQEYTFF